MNTIESGMHNKIEQAKQQAEAELEAKKNAVYEDDDDFLDDLTEEEEAWCDGLEQAMKEGRIEEYMRETMPDYDKMLEAMRRQDKPVEEMSLDEKIECAKKPYVDVREVFTSEEIDEICRRTENFRGKVSNMRKVQRFGRIAKYAKWLHTFSMEVVDYKIEKISRNQPNAMVWMDLRRLCSLRGQELAMFGEMMRLADSVFISGIKDGAIRFSFGIQKIWED